MKKMAEFIRNEKGWLQKMCCASCKNKEIDEEGVRKCLLTGKRVRGCGLCENWKLNEVLKTTLPTQGRIKSRAYQMYVMNVREVEVKMKSQGMPITPVDVENIRRDFEAMNGEIFIKF